MTTMEGERNMCVICNDPIEEDANGWAGGHNADPVAKGQCCQACNRDLVTPARLQQVGYSHEQITQLLDEFDWCE